LTSKYFLGLKKKPDKTHRTFKSRGFQVQHVHCLFTYIHVYKKDVKQDWIFWTSFIHFHYFVYYNNRVYNQVQRCLFRKLGFLIIYKYMLLLLVLFLFQTDIRTISVNHWGSELGLKVLNGLSKLVVLVV
jgi:hypothetical protein